MTLKKRILNKIFKKSESTLDYCYRNGFTSGSNFSCFSACPIDPNWPWLISVGNDVTISSNVTILAHDASTSFKHNGVRSSTKVGIVRIGNNVFVGSGATILCNTRIGDNVIIGAKSVVTKDIPSNSVVSGNPAKIIGSFDEYVAKHDLYKSQKTICDKYRWNEWKNAPLQDKLEMAKQLESDFGYVK